MDIEEMAKKTIEMDAKRAALMKQKQEEQQKLEAERQILATEKDKKNVWYERKQMHPDLWTLEETRRLLAEKEAKLLAQQKDQVETAAAREKIEKDYWDAIVASCSDPEVRDANYIIRAGKMNLFVETVMMPVAEKVRRINQLRRLHHQTDSKEKLNLADYIAAADLFVSDPIVHRGDVSLKRKIMFPPVTL